MNHLSYYRDVLGFDRSSNTFGRPNLVSIACSQCKAVVINGHATHERGCPHDTRECKGCNARIPSRQLYCEDCQ